MRNPIKSNPSIGTEKRLTEMLEESNNTGASEAGPCILILLPIFEFSTFPFSYQIHHYFNFSLSLAEQSHGQNSACRTAER